MGARIEGINFPDMSAETFFDGMDIGYGAFLYPNPITVCDDNVELIRTPRQERAIALYYALAGGQRVVVTGDGFFGVYATRSNALVMINTIFAAALTWSLGNEKIVNSDLSIFCTDAQRSVIKISTRNLLSASNVFSFQRDEVGERYVDWSKVPRRRVNIDTLKKILDRSYDYSTKPDLQHDLLMLAEGWTLLYGDS